ncbi:MAG: hypothetical protein K8F27_14730, partial [Sulfuricellaceae bacterium]|nr:hypothetical protein [Sulfuricellaceae bacterium]
MSTISEIYTEAELALAAYANLTAGISGKSYTDALEDGGKGMSPLQAADFASKWTVIGTPYTDPVTGVSATVFQEIATGQKTLAIRGTQGATDFLADYLILNGTPSQLNPQYQSLKAKVTQWLGDGTLTPGFTVSGHSLGGYLAAGLVADFPNSISHAYLYNAPGNNSIVSQIMQALGIATTPDAAKITSLRADAGVSPIAGLGNDFSPPIHIAIENQLDPALILSAPPALNHSQQVLTDALALYKLFATVDPNASVGTITAILEAASNTAANSLETALAAVGKMFGKTYSAIETTRDDLYAHLYDLQATLSSSSAGLLTITSLATKSASDIATLAKSDIATRYALNELNPFALVGDAGLYAPFNAHGELDLYDPATGTGNLSDLYLADRAALLSWKDYFNKDDKTPVKIDYKGEQYAFKDDASGYTVLLGNDSNIQSVPVSALRQVHFGTGADDTLAGGDKIDHLYGGSGNDILAGGAANDALEGQLGNDTLKGDNGRDTLIGGQGDDMLEGGQGADRLEGGLGVDTYQLNSNDGNDTILDADGQGIVQLDGTTLNGGDYRSPGLWAKGGVTYQFNPGANGRGDLIL